MRQDRRNKGKNCADAVKSEMSKKKLQHWEIIAFYLIIYDAVSVNFAYFFGLWLRFDLRFSAIPQEYLNSFYKFAPVYTVFVIVVLYVLHLYNSLWKFASFSELNRITLASLITMLFHVFGTIWFTERMPISYYVIGGVVQYVLIIAVRFAYRYVTLERGRRKKNQEAMNNAMVIGAGDAGQIILRELKNSNVLKARPLCVIDDNPNKWGRMMEGVPIVGGRDSILEKACKYNIDQILFAIPTASAEDKREILNICKETGCKLQSLPGVFQLVNGEVSLRKMKPVAVEELLGRDAIKINMEEIFQYIRGKIILVTGGGGSIGSELCRQIADHEPKHLIIFDIYENNAYDIEQELKRRHPELRLSTVIGSVRDSARINWVFEHYKPNIVYHAAAHKHVPLMESNPNEAIKNNVIGTYKTAYAALKNGTQRFILISTDKAVNPTNIMGASKRLCEMVIQSMDAISREKRIDLLPLLHAHKNDMPNDATEGLDAEHAAGKKAGIRVESVRDEGRTGTQFVAVRFGNVLGSNGSVIPLFKKQIEAGGPVTVTHPDISRYFMTIPEAVSLVLEAGIYAWGGEIFVLDMGDPVKIDTLARNLIKLSGYKPDEDIKIVYTGLRPGEKLFEEKLMAEEGMQKTHNKLIHIGKPIPFDTERFLKQLEDLAMASYRNSPEVVRMVEDIVPTFHPVGDNPTGNECIVNETAEADKIKFVQRAATIKLTQAMPECE